MKIFQEIEVWLIETFLFAKELFADPPSYQGDFTCLLVIFGVIAIAVMYCHKNDKKWKIEHVYLFKCWLKMMERNDIVQKHIALDP